MSQIDDKYASLPNARTILGDPTGPEGDALDGGRYRHYQLGSIYYHPSVGAHEVHGAIHAKWAALGWERGLMGFPSTDETVTPDAVGRFNHFQHGSIYWTPGTGAREVHGPILDVWSATGWEQGAGYPTTDITTVADFANIDVCWFTRQIIASPAIAPPEPFVMDRSTGALLVVAPNADFVEAATPFMAHKRGTGIPTFVHLIGVVAPYDDGAPFTLKGYIAEAVAWLQVRWVLLGDTSLIPTRHRCTTGLPAGHLGTAWYTPTDFYYADLYSGGPQFARPVGSAPAWVPTHSWDSNGNHQYDEHHWADDARGFNPDNVQAVPEVAIGRIPAHTADQAAAYLSKVIAYETNEPTGSTSVSILTDYNYYSQNGNNYLAASLMDRAQRDMASVDSIGLDWPDGAATPGALRVGGRWATRMATASSRTVVYIGHGAPSVWAVSSDTFGWVDQTNVETFRNWSNQPIVLGIGCATAQLMPNAPEDGRYHGVDGIAHDYEMTGSTVVDNAAPPPPHPTRVPIDAVHPSPFDFADASSPGFGVAWLLNPYGGGIIYLGEAAVCPDTWGVELLGRVLRHMQGGAVIGDAWLQGQLAYRADFLSSDDRQGAPRIYLTYMHLFGDPSLRLW